MPVCETTRNAILCMRSRLIAKAAILASTLRAQQAGKPAVGHDQPERPVGRVQQPLRDRNALLLVGVEQRRVCLPLTTSASFHARL